MLGSAAVLLLVNAATSFLKKWVYPRWGKPGVHALVFTLSMVVALYVTFGEKVPSLQIFVIASIGVFSTAVTVYEVLLQYIPMFKGGDQETE